MLEILTFANYHETESEVDGRSKVRGQGVNKVSTIHLEEGMICTKLHGNTSNN